MKKHVILLFLSPLVLFAHNNIKGQSKYTPGFSKGDSIPIHVQQAQTSCVKNDASINEFQPGTELPLNKDSMIALFKIKALDFSQGTKFSYINSSLPQTNNKTLSVGQDATYTLMQVPFSAGTRYSTSDDLIRWTRALHNDQFVDLTNSQKRRQSRFGWPGLWIGD
jgi:hypothetical protein